MTEQEWLACADPGPMLRALFPLVKPGIAGSLFESQERFRRFAVACARRVDALLGPHDRKALDLLDRYIDTGNHADLRAARTARKAAERALIGTFAASDFANHLQFRARELANRVVRVCAEGRPTRAAMAYGEALGVVPYLVALNADPTPTDEEWQGARRDPDPAELAAQSDLLRDIFGNPFRRVAWQPEWVTETTESLALRMHETRDFAAMPVLADALEDAGCDNADILEHCRANTAHVRGCWVVALLLGRDGFARQP